MELFQHFFTSSTSVEFTALLATLVLCSLIGLERQVRQKAAGLRTNVLVGMGSCTFTLVSGRSEEHTSELQSRGHLVCRLLLEEDTGGLASGAVGAGALSGGAVRAAGA